MSWVIVVLDWLGRIGIIVAILRQVHRLMGTKKAERVANGTVLTYQQVLKMQMQSVQKIPLDPEFVRMFLKKGVAKVETEGETWVGLKEAP